VPDTLIQSFLSPTGVLTPRILRFTVTYSFGVRSPLVRGSGRPLVRGSTSPELPAKAGSHGLTPRTAFPRSRGLVDLRTRGLAA
jgi:hypothetical protein